MPLITVSDRRPRRWLTGVALVGAGLGAFAAPSLGATAPVVRHAVLPGTTFVGETTRGHVALIASRDGRQLTRAFVGYTFKCSDGSSATDFDGFRAIPITAARTFTSSFDTGVVPGGETGTTIRYTGHIDGRINKARTRIVGTARFTFVSVNAAAGTTETCDTGTIRFTAKD